MDHNLETLAGSSFPQPSPTQHNHNLGKSTFDLAALHLHCSTSKKTSDLGPRRTNKETPVHRRRVAFYRVLFQQRKTLSLRLPTFLSQFPTRSEIAARHELDDTNPYPQPPPLRSRAAAEASSARLSRALISYKTPKSQWLDRSEGLGSLARTEMALPTASGDPASARTARVDLR